MGGETEGKPKCLAPLAGRTLLEWQIGALRAADLSDIAALGGYRCAMLEPYLPVAAVNARWSETQMVSTLAEAGSLLEARPTIVSYSDIVYHPDHVRALTAIDADIAITFDTLWLDLWRARFRDPLVDAETFRHENGRLIEIGAKPGSLEEIQGQYMGLIRITPKGWKSIAELLSGEKPETVDHMSMTELLSALIVAGIAVQGAPIEGRWCEIDAPGDLALYRRRLNDANWKHDWRWRRSGGMATP